MRSITVELLGSLALVLVACEPEYAYVPTTSATVTVAGQVAADYGIPPEAPRGDLRVASYGITHISPQEHPDQHLSAIHVRLIAANESSLPWTIDTNEQHIDLDRHGTSAPAWASADKRGGQPPLVDVPPGGKRTIDLFYLLPQDMQEASELPHFDARWQVMMGGERIAARTPFERFRIEPAAGPSEWDYGESGYFWGGPYYMNPLYPQLGFYGAVSVPPVYVQHPVIVHRAPAPSPPPPTHMEAAPHVGGGGPHR